jgi:formylglycine-generating enzyme required for sulfatase activity
MWLMRLTPFQQWIVLAAGGAVCLAGLVWGPGLWRDRLAPIDPPVADGDWTTFKDCPTCPEMVVVPAGAFTFGAGADRFGVVHPVFDVTIARPFAIGRYEVTIGEWAACVAADACPDVEHDLMRDRGPNYPRDGMPWTEARMYPAWLSAETGHAYRLPSVTEWEWAARAGGDTRWPWGDRATNARANLGLGKVIGKVPVGQYPPNAFGLYDVAGNVAEWALDCIVIDELRVPGRMFPADGRPFMPETCGRRPLMGKDYWEDYDSLGLLGWWGLPDGWTNSGAGLRVVRDLTDADLAALGWAGSE